MNAIDCLSDAHEAACDLAATLSSFRMLEVLVEAQLPGRRAPSELRMDHLYHLIATLNDAAERSIKGLCELTAKGIGAPIEPPSQTPQPGAGLVSHAFHGPVENVYVVGSGALNNHGKPKKKGK